MRASVSACELSWPVEQLPEAMACLAEAAGISFMTPPHGYIGYEPVSDDDVALRAHVESTGEAMHLDVEPVDVSYAQLPELLTSDEPKLVCIRPNGLPRWLAIVGSKRERLTALSPDRSMHPLTTAAVRSALCAEEQTRAADSIEALLDRAGISGRGRGKARAALLSERLSTTWVRGCFLIRTPASAPIGRQLCEAGLLRRVGMILAAHLGEYLLLLLAWLAVGMGALQGRFDRGWLLAWCLVLMTIVPIRMLATWWQGLFSVTAGWLLKRRLLAGALRLKPDEIRHEGAGRLLARVLESEAVETLAITGGFLALVSCIELVLAGAILALGAGGLLHVALLAVWLCVTLAVAWRYASRRGRWTDDRLTMTHDLVEVMAGHRTRLAQQPPERWHDGEEQALERYLPSSRFLDQSTVLLTSVVPNGWLVLGLLGLTPAFAYQIAARSVAPGVSPAHLAIALGGVLLAYQSFGRFALGVSHLAGAVIAWRQVSGFFHAAERPEMVGSASAAPHAEPGTEPATLGEDGRSLLEFHDVAYRHRGRSEPVLRGCSLTIRAGQRVLLEGSSGGGKSTLASILTGLRAPDSGLVLLKGLDRSTLGARGWVRRIAAAPQYHENHVLLGTLAFNLLMGRRWPPRAEDVQEAQAICEELGLGPLIARMPGGLLQMIGETGWQLSQGERSRVYIARSLLQQAEVIILDESFAALDPENLQRAMDCVIKRAPTLLVIAHP